MCRGLCIEWSARLRPLSPLACENKPNLWWDWAYLPKFERIVLKFSAYRDNISSMEMMTPSSSHGVGRVIWLDLDVKVDEMSNFSLGT